MLLHRSFASDHPVGCSHHANTPLHLFLLSGHQIGSILSLLMSPSILGVLGWPWVFYLYASLGFLWAAVWQPLVSDELPYASAVVSLAVASATAAHADSPSGLQPKDAGDAEARVVLKSHAVKCGDTGVVRGFGFKNIPWGLIAHNRAFWALAVAHATFGIGYNLAMSWLPAYYSQQFGVNVRESSSLSILPWSVMAITTNLSGWAADALINRKVVSTTKARKLMQALGTLGPGCSLLFLGCTAGQTGQTGQIGLTGALLLLTLTMAGLGCQAGGFASNHQDITTKYAGVLFGLTNALSSFGGSVSVYMTGVVLDLTHSWSLVFRTVAWCNFLCLGVYLTYATSEPQFD